MKNGARGNSKENFGVPTFKNFSIRVHKEPRPFEQTEKNLNKERILRKTLEIIERPFTTEPKRYVKRGCHTVRDRCLRYNAILRTIYGIEREVPLEQAKEIFQKEMGIWDRTSLKAYFGTQETVSKRKMQRISRYPRTGTMSFKIIELEQPIKKKKGYLEKLGLVAFEKRGPTWFMLLKEYNTIHPELTHPPKPPLLRESESLELEASIDKISLTPILQGKEREKTVLEVVSPIETTEKRESYRVREKFDNTVIKNRTGVFSTYPKEDTLSPEELRILKASTREAV